MQPFIPVSKRSVSMEIATQISEMVQSGELKPGERLPTERSFCELFHVGRGSVREAIKMLETAGVVERRAMAVWVCEPAVICAGVDLDTDDIVRNIHHIVEARNIIETNACQLAAIRSDKDDIIKLQRAANVDNDSLEAFSIQDRAFHQTVVDAAHNPILSQIYAMVTDLIFRTEELYSSMDSIQEEQQRILQQNSAFHQKIIQAIGSRDKLQATACMQDHLNQAGQALAESVQKCKTSMHEEQQSEMK